jgi:GNAT superfamily N-acetyltransferase
MKIAIKQLSNENKQDFYRVHNDQVCGGWCFCAAWWVPTWEGFGERTSADNRMLREELFDKQVYDGYIVYLDDVPQGWCQVGKRDQFSHLLNKFALEPDAEVWAITCMAIPERFQGLGLTHKILSLIIDDLRSRGVTRLQAYPKADQNLPKMEIWTGPLSLYLKAGFKVVKADVMHSVLELNL